MSMKLIFFDEAKNESEYHRYHIGAVGIDDSHLFEIEGEVNQLVEQAFGSSRLEKATELHAAEIYHRKNNFKSWADVGDRLNLLDSMLQIISKPQVELIDIQINTDRLHDTQIPDEIAFMFLCERANDLCAAQNCLGMLIGDRENDRVSERYATSLSGYRARGTDFQFGRDIRNLVDSVHFTHSHLSRFLQLADVYTWILQFCNRNRDSEDHRHQAVFNIINKDEVNLFSAKYKEWPKS